MPLESIRHHFALTLRAGADLRLRLLESGMENLLRATEAVSSSLRRGGKLLLFGNGGSAADAQHIATEFVCRFKHSREPLPALSLVTDTSALTAIGNDYGFEQIFARQVLAQMCIRDRIWNSRWPFNLSPPRGFPCFISMTNSGIFGPALVNAFLSSCEFPISSLCLAFTIFTSGLGARGWSIMIM